ncbi:MAG: hypothetical protein ACUZ8E_15770 [Candidatus Anammoxibacter sp.]
MAIIIGWTGAMVKQRRTVVGRTMGFMANALGMSTPTYKKLENGINVQRYEVRLEKYYNGGYKIEQLKILKELGLYSLIDAKNKDRKIHK